MTGPVTIWVPMDSAARALGADEVAEALARAAAARGEAVRIIRNGSRGAVWTEPLVVIDRGAGQIGHASATPDQAGAILDGRSASVGSGRDQGLVYIRSEYPGAIAVMSRAPGILGPDVAGSGRAFDIEIRAGAGAYVCGEETSLLNSLEGRRGTRARQAAAACAVRVSGAANGGQQRDHPGDRAGDPGQGRGALRRVRSRPLARHRHPADRGQCRARRPLRDRVRRDSGRCGPARRWRHGQRAPGQGGAGGGPLGAYMPASAFDTPIGYEEFDHKGALIGHAGLVVLDETADMLSLARFAMDFCAIENCGKCTPCRIGAVRGVETIDRIAAGDGAAIALLSDLCEVMRDGSVCALGGFTPYPVLSALTQFPADFAIPRKAAE